MSENLLKNIWYMAGWASELAVGSLARRIIDIPVIVVRAPSGSIYALEDKCPHRFAPLSRGRITEQGIECGYHGLVFGPNGTCVSNPLGPVPAACRVRVFPVVMQDKILWVWMGDPTLADTGTIPRFPSFNESDQRFVFGVTDAAANYQLLTDNLLDLTHAVFLHPAFGRPTDRPRFTMERNGDTVYARYVTPDVESTPFFESFYPTRGANVDLWDDMRWDAPACHYLESGVVLAGRPHAEGKVTPAAHILTPQSPTRTSYFWASAIPSEDIPAEAFLADLRKIFETEDLPMIEAIQRQMGSADFWSLKPVLLKNDSAAVIARRVLSARIAAETATGT